MQQETFFFLILSKRQHHHSIVWKWIPSLHSPVWSASLRPAVQRNQRWRTLMWGFQMQKERPLGSEARQKQFQLLNLGSLFLETLVLYLDRSTVCSWRTGCEEQLPRFSASLVIFQCRWVSRKVRQTEGLRVKDVNRKPTNTEHSHEAAL